MAKKKIQMTESQFKDFIKKIVLESEMTRSLEDEFDANPTSTLKKAMKMTIGMNPEQRLQKINDMVGGYGVESIEGDGDSRYWMGTVALYINMGDTYNTTLLYNTDLDKYTITTWGDWVERNQKRYGIQ